MAYTLHAKEVHSLQESFVQIPTYDFYDNNMKNQTNALLITIITTIS